MQSRKYAARILTKGSSNLLHITNFSLVWVPPVTYTWQANSRKNESDMMNTSVSWDAMMMAVDSSSACFACRNMPVSASSCVLYKLSTQGVLCYPKAFSLIGDVHDFHDHPSFNSTWLCYESLFWLIASTSLGPRTWWHCFCFWVRTKDASTALLCGQQRCCWKEYRYLTHDWLFRHFWWIHQGIHQIPRQYGNSLPQHMVPTWKWLQSINQSIFI